MVDSSVYQLDWVELLKNIEPKNQWQFNEIKLLARPSKDKTKNEDMLIFRYLKYANPVDLSIVKGLYNDAQTEILELETYGKKSCLLAACANQQCKIETLFCLLKEIGVKSTVKDSENQTALMVYCFNTRVNDVEAIECLSKQPGNEIEQQDALKNTALI